MKCRLCQSEIPDGATVCQVCKNNQHRFMNSLPYLTGLAAILTVFASILLFTFDQWHEFFTSHFGAVQVRLVAADSNSEVCVLNTGDRPVFVSYVVLETPASKWKAFFPINEVLSPGKLLTKLAPDNFGSYLSKFRPVKGAKAYLWKQNIWKPTTRYIWFTQDHPVLQGLVNGDPTLITAPGSASVIYYATNDYTKHTLKADCTTLLVEIPGANGTYAKPPDDALSKVPPEYQTTSANSNPTGAISRGDDDSDE
ncbi:MAG TPA: hypothetical protein VFE46_15345 [Pirellulales bacterium]|jgi:hypothetical protein|nr:hypothetical protein [Pirellulales bacterium]